MAPATFSRPLARLRYPACTNSTVPAAPSRAPRAVAEEPSGLAVAAALEDVLVKAIAESERSVVAIARVNRNAPDREPVAREATTRLVAEYPGAYVLQPGKMVYEIKPKDVDKGRALRAFLDEPPFTGRTPVFAGDDLTDEKGFVVVNEKGGLSIKVGGGDTIARSRIGSVSALLAWLSEIVAAARNA